MKLLEFTVRTDTGAYDLEAGARWIGDDLLVAVWGGEKPHIGAAAAAQSRPSLRDPEVVSATASVICFPAHKEDELAKAAAEVLAAAIDARVVVTAGIHWDNISREGIEKVIRNSEIIVDLLLEKLMV
ncbi:MAG: hypothetical protein GY859_40975 [Desulfobacterales bacterium]|nr:hypothetical protein [Desulfobacterales bacterium]